jgi:hypothetical protein
VADDVGGGAGTATSLIFIQNVKRLGWAAGSAVALRFVELPPEVRRVTLLVDGDDAGRAATQDAARRLKATGRRVFLAKAPEGMDWNDVLMEATRVKL